MIPRTRTASDWVSDKASLTGSGHSRHSLPNQGAHAANASHGGCAIATVVGDGAGSNSYSHVASMAASQVMATALISLYQSGDVFPDGAEVTKSHILEIISIARASRSADACASKLRRNGRPASLMSVSRMTGQSTFR